MRKYEPIWSRIKSKNHASIVTHPNNVARVIKAVNKEKNIDTGYKLLLAESALKAILYTTKQRNKESDFITVHFSLKTSLHEPYIGINTL